MSGETNVAENANVVDLVWFSKNYMSKIVTSDAIKLFDVYYAIKELEILMNYVFLNFVFVTSICLSSFAKVEISKIEKINNEPVYLLYKDAVSYCSNLGLRLPTARELIEERIAQAGGKITETQFGNCDLMKCHQELAKESLSVDGIRVDTPKPYPGYVYKELFRDFYYKVEPSIPDFNEYAKSYWTSSLSPRPRPMSGGLVEYVYPYLFTRFNNVQLIPSDDQIHVRGYVRCAMIIDSEEK